MIGVGIAAGASMIGSGIGMGYLFGQVIASIHRQPEAFEQSRPWMFFGLAFVEQFAIFGILFALLINYVF
ncbi:MAG: ATP synthase F0 subunit C [Rubrobacteraceae bacterium]|nr:ATP synthase F0 subunit C [Rubrobacteraceae bacterium]